MYQLFHVRVAFCCIILLHTNLRRQQHRVVVLAMHAVAALMQLEYAYARCNSDPHLLSIWKLCAG